MHGAVFRDVGADHRADAHAHHPIQKCIQRDRRLLAPAADGNATVFDVGADGDAVAIQCHRRAQQHVVGDMDGETVVSEAVVLGLGTFLTTIIDFLLIAFVVFLVVKAMNMAKAKLEKPAEPEPEKEPEPTKEEQLLTEIRDLLKNK